MLKVDPLIAAFGWLKTQMTGYDSKRTRESMVKTELAIINMEKAQWRLMNTLASIVIIPQDLLPL